MARALSCTAAELLRAVVALVTSKAHAGAIVADTIAHTVFGALMNHLSRLCGNHFAARLGRVVTCRTSVTILTGYGTVDDKSMGQNSH